MLQDASFNKGEGAAALQLAQIEQLTRRIEAAARAHDETMATARLALEVVNLMATTPRPRDHSHINNVRCTSTSGALQVPPEIVATGAQFLASIDLNRDRVASSLGRCCQRVGQQQRCVQRFCSLSRTLLLVFDDPPTDCSEGGEVACRSRFLKELRQSLRKLQVSRERHLQENIAEVRSAVEEQRNIFSVGVENMTSNSEVARHHKAAPAVENQVEELLHCIQSSLHHVRRQRSAVVDALEERMQSLVEMSSVVP